MQICRKFNFDLRIFTSNNKKGQLSARKNDRMLQNICSIKFTIFLGHFAYTGRRNTHTSDGMMRVNFMCFNLSLSLPERNVLHWHFSSFT